MSLPDESKSQLLDSSCKTFVLFAEILNMDKEKEHETLKNNFKELMKNNKKNYTQFILGNLIEIQEGTYFICPKMFENQAFKNVESSEELKVKLPKSLITISQAAFRNSPFSEIIFPDEPNIKEIGPGAFAYCINLKIITIPATIKVIEKSTFEGCENLESVSFSDGSQLQKVCQKAFYGCINLKTIIFPKTVTKVEEFAFYDCYQLNNLSIPGVIVIRGASVNYDPNVQSNQNVDDDEDDQEASNNYFQISSNCFAQSKIDNCDESKQIKILISKKCNFIGKNAFKNSPSLKEISFDPDQELKIEESAFENCTNMDKVFFGANPQISKLTINDFAFRSCTKIKSISIPNSPHIEIGKYIFKDCSKLERIDIPKNITEIPEGMFENCPQLIYFSTINDEINLNDEINKINSKAFNECKSISFTKLPSELTEIEPYTFNNCTNLQAEKIPDGVKIIKEYAFQNTKIKINTDTFPPNLTEIQQFAFAKCNEIVELEIPEKVDKLGDNCFDGCEKLQKVKIKSTNTVSYGEYLFKDCTKLMDFESMSENETNDSMFHNCNPDICIVENGNNFSYSFCPVD